ncbi:MAG: HEAT repeat domain-containing protein [Thermoguttaceae bacterium]|nr:HEAT repeat domain-containing protein [Thermoguttaceae bacterium]MDW8079107.1 HEAT repeat domain-containing protein [Thermoguttaceae bacterium]
MHTVLRILSAALIPTGCAVSWLGCGEKSAKHPPGGEPASFQELSTDECVKLLAHRSAIVRRQAVAELAARGRSVVPLVARQLAQKGNSPARSAAAEVLAKLGPEAAEAVPVLAEAIFDRGWTGRELAAAALGEIGPSAASAVGALTTVLREDEEPPVRMAAARALGRLASAGVVLPSEALKALLEALKDSDPTIQAEAAEALGNCSNPPPEVVTALENLARSETFIVRQAAEEALRRLRNPRGK